MLKKKDAFAIVPLYTDTIDPLHVFPLKMIDEVRAYTGERKVRVVIVDAKIYKKLIKKHVE